MDVERRQGAHAAASYVDAIGANFGRVRIIKLEPQDHEQALKSFHRDDNNRFNPDGRPAGWCAPGSSSPTTPTATCC